jgi:hypothetical protein
MKFNYNALQDLDFVFTTSMSFLALVIRQREAGWKNIFNTNIATHEGRIVTLTNAGVRVVMIAEMMKDNDGQHGDLKLHPLSSYAASGKWCEHVVSIKRTSAYSTNPDLRHEAVNYILDLWNAGKTKYDIGGAAKWDFSFLKDKKSEYYCSEFSEHIDQEIAKFSSVGLLGKTDDVMPSQHQNSGLLFEVKDWRTT